MNIYFDLDYTLIAYNGEPRPLVRETLAKLRSDQHRTFIWSGLGVRVPEVTSIGLIDLVDGVFEKPVDNFEERLSALGITARPHAVVDDHEEIVEYFGGVHIKPYFWPDQNDRELEKAYAELNRMSRQFDINLNP